MIHTPQIALAQTQRYLDTLWPDPPPEAWLVVSRTDPVTNFPSAWFRAAEMDAAAQWLTAQAPTHNVYIAMGLHRPDHTPTAGTRGAAATVCAIPGLWVELDHNQGTHASPTLPSPDALKAFIANLPFQFSLLVDSGGGFHAYLLFKEPWVFETPDDHAAAGLLVRRFQRTLQARATEQGWHIDQTYDLARVLRPTGTLNHKGSPPRPVTIMQDERIRYNPSELMDAPWLLTIEDTYQAKGKRADGPPAPLAPIVQGCAWLRHTRDDAATLDEPAWYAMLSIVGRTEEGEDTAHDWSAPYPGYTAEETDKKLAQALEAAGPRTCQFIRYELGGDPYCRDCQHWGKVTSPILLGRRRQSRVPVGKAVAPTGEVSTAPRPPRLHGLAGVEAFNAYLGGLPEAERRAAVFAHMDAIAKVGSRFWPRLKDVIAWHLGPDCNVDELEQARNAAWTRIYTPTKPATTMAGGSMNGTHGASATPEQSETVATPALHDQGTAEALLTCPTIYLDLNQTRIINEGQAALMALPGAPIVYQRARALVAIAHGVKPPRWLHRPEDMPIMVEASGPRLSELAGQAADWMKEYRTGKWTPVLPPPWFVPMLQARPSWPFPVLEGIVNAPTLRPDGSLLDTPGYDEATGLYLEYNGTAFPPGQPCPTLDDARTAIGYLQEAVADFPFAAPHHFSATLAAILALVCRYAIMGNVPLFAIRANTRGSGKSLLADVISIIGTGRTAPRWPQVREDDEERKRLLTVALAGYPCLHIDNVTRPLGSPALDLALTASSFSDRILGKNESREAPLNMVWLATGNNMQFQGDTARRVVPIDLDPKMERPEERTDFKHDPLGPWVRQERPRLTVAALTIIQAYFAAGCPAQGITPMGSFEQWSDLVRHALVWAGEADPNEGRKDLEAESNPEYEQLAQLLAAWEACYPIQQGMTRSAAKTLRDVLDDIAALKAMDKPRVNPDKPNTPNEYDALQEALGACDRRYDGKMLHPRMLGEVFSKFQGRMIGTRRFINAGKDRMKIARWQMEAW